MKMEISGILQDVIIEINWLINSNVRLKLACFCHKRYKDLK